MVPIVDPLKDLPGYALRRVLAEPRAAKDIFVREAAGRRSHGLTLSDAALLRTPKSLFTDW